MSGSIIISWGKYGGFYVAIDYTKRLCLGWAAITYIPLDIDVLFQKTKDQKGVNDDQ